MKTAPEVSTEYGLSNVLNNLLNFELNSKEFLANETVITKIGTILDNIKLISDANILFSIIRNTNRQLIFILKASNVYTIAKWNLLEEIEKPIDVILHESNYNDELSHLISEYRSSYFNMIEIISCIIVPTLTGFSINKRQISMLKEFKENTTNHHINNKNLLIEKFPGYEDLYNLTSRLLNVQSFKDEILEKINNLIQSTNTEVVLSPYFPTNSTINIFIGEISSIKEVGSRRYYKLNWMQGSNYGTYTSNKHSGTSENCNPYHKSFYLSRNITCNDTFQYDYLKIPYNLIDKGRIFIGLSLNTNSWYILASPDPKVEENYKLIFEENIINFIKDTIEEDFSLRGTYIEDKIIKARLNYDQYENRIKNISGVRLKLKALKTFIDEFNYIIKKNSALGEDVTISENIKYNHKDGKIKYNDFSIAINDEYIKAQLYQLFNNYLISYYRSEITEQEILDNILSKIFITLSTRLSGNKKEDLNIPININEKININITGKVSNRCAKKETGEKDETQVVSSSQLYYINDRRFNKNEIIMVLKEITCYQNQQEANNFIENIGRLGLSVYIGISTGYEINLSRTPNEENNKLFRFKKLKGRSNYELLLDDTSIPISGKKLISILYSNFIEERIPDINDKIQKSIIDGSDSCINYIKYKTLIDSTYKAFKDKSKEYLDKKVIDFNAEYIKYHNKKTHKLMDGIKLIGSSGKEYVISYNNKDSYVFMSPVKSNYNSVDCYTDGKYICMIDQSNIKSNISYDTVIAKMLALKNDSTIAHTIYNLQEEL